MFTSFFLLVLFVGLLAAVPWAIRWIQRRTPGGMATAQSASRLVSALAVGPQQRVVTVEVGPEGNRLWLVLGVTPQSITCLHTSTVPLAPTVVSDAGSAAPDFLAQLRGSSKGD